MPKNKVKFNLRNVYYAKLTINEDGSYTFGIPVPMPGAVSLSMDPNGEPSVFYADGYAYYTISINQGYDENRTIDQTLDLGWELLSMLPESELDRVDEDVLKEHLDSFHNKLGVAVLSYPPGKYLTVEEVFYHAEVPCRVAARKVSNVAYKPLVWLQRKEMPSYQVRWCILPHLASGEVVFLAEMLPSDRREGFRLTH